MSQCPLFLVSTMLTSPLKERLDLNPFNKNVREATECLKEQCAWYTKIIDPQFNREAASCAIAWLGHQAILEAIRDSKKANAENPG